jgi:Domain of Unknown Function (DUF928)
VKYLVITYVSLALALTAWQGATASDQSVTSPAAQQGDELLPTYSPPKKFAPRARVGGALRGTRGMEGAELEIVALVPDHVGLTIKQTPTLNWYLSKATTYPLRFTLNNSQKILPVYDATLPTPTEAGVQSIDLKSLGLTLEPNVQYRWFVSAQRNADSHSEDIVAGGMIERCELNDCLIVYSPNMTCDRESVRTNAMIGLWYDAMDCICSLIVKDPKDPSLRKMRATLLRQVGLNGVADWDLGAIQRTAR